MVLLARERSDRYLECDRSAHTTTIPQEPVIDSIPAWFNLLNASTVTTPLAPRTHHSVADCPTSQDEIKEMATRPYTHGFPSGLTRISHSPPVHSPASNITPVASIGERPNESCVTSRRLRGGVSS